jgi:hypothetical protein
MTMTVAIPAATIAVARRVGWLRGWLFCCCAYTVTVAIYFLVFHGHRDAQSHPWITLFDAVWSGLNFGTVSWAVLASVVGILEWARRRAAR